MRAMKTINNIEGKRSDSPANIPAHIPESEILASLNEEGKSLYNNYFLGKTVFLLDNGDWGIYLHDYENFKQFLKKNGHNIKENQPTNKS
jgi:hypothetical protein